MLAGVAASFTVITGVNHTKEYGFLVSMDDFGSGYSSLNSLKDMPLDVLKLDVGFFSGDKTDVRARVVVSEALQLARKLNMTTVAEGVEDQSQVDFLAQEGCSMIQGYYYAKPMPGEEYELRIGMPGKPAALKTEATDCESVAAQADETPDETSAPAAKTEAASTEIEQ